MQRGDNKEISGTGAAATKPAPPKKSALLLFVSLLVVFTLVIAATLLLANDRRNLRLLLDRYDIDWMTEKETEKEITQPSGTRALRGRRLTAAPVSIPVQFFAPPEVEAFGAFVREVRAKGADLCAAFKAAGIENNGWQPSQFDTKTYECLTETVFAADENGAQNASFFFIAKGTPEGEIRSIRMKLVAPETPEGDSVHRLFIKAMEQLIAEARWLDLTPAVESAETLTDFTSARFGISFRFTHEFTAPRSYNLIVVPASGDPRVKRSRQFFDQDQWLPVPRAVDRLPDFLRSHLVETRPISPSVLQTGPTARDERTEPERPPALTSPDRPIGTDLDAAP